MTDERRQSPRFSFIAHGELSEERSDTRLKLRVSEISKGGCYVDMMNPLPDGTAIRLQIAAGGALLEVPARIVYSVQHMGAGVRFESLDATNEPILDGWLAELEGNGGAAA